MVASASARWTVRPTRNASDTGIGLLTAIRRQPPSREGGIPAAAASTKVLPSSETRNRPPACAPVTSTARSTAPTSASSRSAALSAPVVPKGGDQRQPGYGASTSNAWVCRPCSPSNRDHASAQNHSPRPGPVLKISSVHGHAQRRGGLGPGCQGIEPSEFQAIMIKTAKPMNTAKKSIAPHVLAASFPWAGALAVARSGRSGR